MGYVCLYARLQTASVQVVGMFYGTSIQKKLNFHNVTLCTSFID